MLDFTCMSGDGYGRVRGAWWPTLCLFGMGAAAPVLHWQSCYEWGGWLGQCLVCVCLGRLWPSRAKFTCPLLLLGAVGRRFSTTLPTLTTIQLQLTNMSIHTHKKCSCTHTKTLQMVEGYYRKVVFLHWCGTQLWFNKINHSLWIPSLDNVL